jgi:hypothetical protein
MVISVSRRTDIPKLYADWFFHRLEIGYVYVRNPMNFNQVSKIALNRGVVDCFVFWSKDPDPMISKLSYLENAEYPYYFQFTLTPYGREMEINLRDKEEIVLTFIKLSKKIGAERVIWRYDPIIINERYTMSYHLVQFKKLCQQLSGYTYVCEISFVDIYSKLKKLVTEGIIRAITDDEMLELTRSFIEISKEYNIQIKVCCEEKLIQTLNIPKANCIDRELIETIIGSKLKPVKV